VTTQGPLTTVVLAIRNRQGDYLLFGREIEDGQVVFDPPTVEVPTSDLEQGGIAVLANAATAFFTNEVFGGTDNPVVCEATNLARHGTWYRADVSPAARQLEVLFDMAEHPEEGETPFVMLVRARDIRAGRKHSWFLSRAVTRLVDDSAA
jgi:hypothetical protein